MEDITKQVVGYIETRDPNVQAEQQHVIQALCAMHHIPLHDVQIVLNSSPNPAVWRVKFRDAIRDSQVDTVVVDSLGRIAGPRAMRQWLDIVDAKHIRLISADVLDTHTPHGRFMAGTLRHALAYHDAVAQFLWDNP